MMLRMGVIVAAIVGAVIAVIAVIAVTRSGVVPRQRTAEEMLHERFARGEIDAAEYHQRLDALQEQRYATREAWLRPERASHNARRRGPRGHRRRPYWDPRCGAQSAGDNYGVYAHQHTACGLHGRGSAQCLRLDGSHG